jgi:ankyrin repeat protein
VARGGMLLLILSLAVAPEQNAGENFYQSIRNNDLAALRSLIREYGAVATDSRGQTPLMFAAAFGSFEATRVLVDAGADVKAVSAAGLTALHLSAGAGDIRKVRLLVDHGADIHARSQMGRTPLLVAAYTQGTSDIVAFLLSKGADTNAADAGGITPLVAAASVNDTASAKLLVERGADVNARANLGQAATALMAAAHNGNVELTRLLLARNASLNVISAPTTVVVKNGPVQFGSATALHFASLSGNSEVVKLLLSAGAEVDAQDVRGMTPLMWLVASDRPNLDILRMLLAKGSDISLRSKLDESAIDWARKFNNPAVLSELKLKAAAVEPLQVLPNRAATTPRTAVERSMPLLQLSSSGMVPKGGCIACHAQPITHMAVVLARDRGWSVGDSFPAESLETLRKLWINADQPLLQGQEGGGTPDSLLYGSVALASAGDSPSWNTDVFVYHLISKQRADGNWHGVGSTRAPIQDGDFSRTAMSIRTLAVYGMPGRKAEIDLRVKRAANWLEAQTPLTTEDRVMQLLGLKWAGTSARVRENRMRELVAQQRAAGGWAQTPFLQSDAYATGQVLYTLREIGMSPTDPAFRRGVDYLLQTQRDDGSWYVKSRAMKIQPYFESGFPYGHDQWISSMATAWAAIGLSRSEYSPPAPVSVAR